MTKGIGSNSGRLGTAAAVLLLVLLASGCETKSGASKYSPLQALLDLPALQGFFHAEILTDRVPLIMICSLEICREAVLTKFGEPVEIVPTAPANGRPFLEITTADQRGDILTVDFLYPVEGVAGSVQLVPKELGWTVLSHRLVEL